MSWWTKALRAAAGYVLPKVIDLVKKHLDAKAQEKKDKPAEDASK